MEFRNLELLETRANPDGTHEADVRLCTYGPVDSWNTSWKPGVFTRSFGESGGTIPSVWNHDSGRPIGVLGNIRDNEQYCDGTITFLPFDDVPDARMAYVAMKRGAYRGISFAFERRAEEPDPNVRSAVRITDADIHECSPVLVGAIPGTKVLAVRSDIRVSSMFAADIITKFAAGQIDLADALTQLKTGETPAVVEEDVSELEKELPPEPDEQEILDKLDELSRAKKPYGDVTYADPKNGKYPIDTKAHAKAAWSYINMPKNAAKYPLNGVTLSSVKARIKAACKKFGVEIND